VTDAIGWASSVILVLTIANQIRKQWQAGTSEGVSIWLFIGQLAASAGFTIYSLLLRNWVFAVTNSVMLLGALLGYAITVRQKRRGSGG
jgi:MtN3 and saliva related transmembrane protein